jgi:hypothetical protein
MIKKLKIEFLYFIILLLILTILLHSDLLTSPQYRIELMIEKENYFHPLLWTSLVYLVIGLLRLVIKYIIYLKRKIKAN